MEVIVPVITDVTYRGWYLVFTTNGETRRIKIATRAKRDQWFRWLRAMPIR